MAIRNGARVASIPQLQLMNFLTRGLRYVINNIESAIGSSLASVSGKRDRESIIAGLGKRIFTVVRSLRFQNERYEVCRGSSSIEKLFQSKKGYFPSGIKFLPSPPYRATFTVLRFGDGIIKIKGSRACPKIFGYKSANMYVHLAAV